MEVLKGTTRCRRIGPIPYLSLPGSDRSCLYCDDAVLEFVFQGRAHLLRSSRLHRLLRDVSALAEASSFCTRVDGWMELERTNTAQTCRESDSNSKQQRRPTDRPDCD